MPKLHLNRTSYNLILLNTLLKGLNNTRHMTKFDTQCTISKGIPDTHHAKAALGPLNTMYGIEHRAPKASPKPPDTIAHTKTDSCFLSRNVISASNGHTYRYIIHHRPNPYIQPSKRINAGMASRIFLSKYRVYRMISRLTSSTFGINARAFFATSIVAIIMPIIAMSFAVIFVLLFIYCVYQSVYISVRNWLLVCAVIAILPIYID